MEKHQFLILILLVQPQLFLMMTLEIFFQSEIFFKSATFILMLMVSFFVVFILSIGFGFFEFTVFNEEILLLLCFNAFVVNAICFGASTVSSIFDGYGSAIKSAPFEKLGSIVSLKQESLNSSLFEFEKKQVISKTIGSLRNILSLYFLKFASMNASLESCLLNYFSSFSADKISSMFIQLKSLA
jgi:hypothetical protein